MALALVVCAGCGTTKSNVATEQLLMSDAVDRSVSGIDFSSLAGQRVFLDTQYIRFIKGSGFVNADYIISALRQPLITSGCLLADSMDDADYVAEARVGAIGTDGHEVTYGLPASNLMTTATTLLPNAPNLPALPELALAKRNDQLGAAKVAVFAYHRESGRPVWQSGTSVATSGARDLWLLGAGPIQRGTIYDGVQFAGSRIELPLVDEDDEEYKAFAEYNRQAYFETPELAESLEPGDSQHGPGTPKLRRLNHDAEIPLK